MKKLVEKFKELETPQIIIMSFAGIAFLVLCYGIFGSSEKEEENNNVQLNSLELPQNEREVSNFDSKMDAYGVKEDNPNSIDLDFGADFFETDISEIDSVKLLKIERLKNQIEAKKNNVYAEEDDEIIKKLQDEIEAEEKTSLKHTPVRTAIRTEQKKPELTYEEKLKRARESKMSSTKRQQNEPIKIETRAAIYRDQFRLPGDLVELVLTKPFSYNGKAFKAGTPMYADINIKNSRVLFDITNIAHQPMAIEARDIRDGRLGMYSERAGELWQIYEDEAINKANEGVADEIENATSSRTLSGSIKAISNFFKKKRLRESDKILFLNDQEVIIHITPE